MNEKILIKIAETEEEKRTVFRLRYDIFFKEFGDDRYAHHLTREFRDVDDDRGDVWLFGAYHGKELIGTTRLKFLCQQGSEMASDMIIAQSHYCLDSLSELVKQPMMIGVVDRGAVKRSSRGLGTFEKIYEPLRCFAAKSN